MPSQLEVAAAAGIWNPLHLGDVKDLERSTYTLVIRCYKPGYQTMEVASGTTRGLCNGCRAA